MDQLKKLIAGLLLMGVLSLQAQVTNTGEMTVVSGTQVGVIADFTNTDKGSVNNNGELLLYGDYNNEGLFSFVTTAGGTVSFLGNKVQRLSGNGANKFYRVVFNNTSGPIALELSSTITIENHAEFIQGIVKNEGFGGSLLFGPTAIHSGTSMNSFVDGAVLKEGNSTFTFPIGNGGFYRPPSISETDGTNAVFETRYLLENSNADYPHNVFLGNIGFINDMEYWTLDRTQGTSNPTFTLGWDSATTPTELLSADTSDIHIVRWDSEQGAWVDEGGIVNAENQTVTTSAPVKTYGIFTLAKVSTDETDTDKDGVPNFVEENSIPPTDPDDPNDYTDTDGDGVPDYVENNTLPGSDPNNTDDFEDGDGDGIPDYVEDFGVDSDGDGVPDYIELTGDPTTDPNDPTDFADSDGDGVPDYVETNQEPKTDPTNPADFVDSDGDGVPDYVEINGKPATNPNDPTDFSDSDGDGIPDYIEGSYIKDNIFIENDMVSKSKPEGFFEIINIERFPDNTVEIFNRNGLLVFNIDGYDNNLRVFRGISYGKATLRKGEGLPTGVYFYIIKYIKDGNRNSKSGYLYIKQ